MEVSIVEAAALLGQSERQVRYLIKKGRIRARKLGGRWMIATEELPLSEGQRQAAAARMQAVRDAAEEALAPTAQIEAKKAARRFSVRDLRAFRSGEPIYQAVVKQLGDACLAALALRRSLKQLCQGCHAFRPTDKAARYIAAREEAAEAVMELFLESGPDDQERSALADRIEQEYIPDLTSLIRVTERSSRRERFGNFGAGRARER